MPVDVPFNQYIFNTEGFNMAYFLPLTTEGQNFGHGWSFEKLYSWWGILHERGDITYPLWFKQSEQISVQFVKNSFTGRLNP